MATSARIAAPRQRSPCGSGSHSLRGRGRGCRRSGRALAPARPAADNRRIAPSIPARRGLVPNAIARRPRQSFSVRRAGVHHQTHDVRAFFVKIAPPPSIGGNSRGNPVALGSRIRRGPFRRCLNANSAKSANRACDGAFALWPLTATGYFTASSQFKRSRQLHTAQPLERWFTVQSCRWRPWPVARAGAGSVPIPSAISRGLQLPFGITDTGTYAAHGPAHR